MKQLAMALLLILATAYAADTVATSRHSNDELFAVMTEMQKENDIRFTSLEATMTSQHKNISTSQQLQLEGMEQRMMNIENQEKWFIEERTNPLRTNLINIVFFALCILYIMKRIADEEMRILALYNKKLLAKPKKKKKWGLF